MSKILPFLPLLLVGATVSSSGYIDITSNDLMPSFEVLGNAGLSYLNVGLKVLPYIVGFGLLVWVIDSVMSKFSPHK